MSEDIIELYRTNCEACRKTIHIEPGPGLDLCAACQIANAIPLPSFDPSYN